MRRLRLPWLAILSALLLWGCDDKPQADEPPEWVKEAHERSKKQRQDQDERSPTAPEPTRPAADEDGEDEPLMERALLWKIDGPNGPVFLFGTVHGGLGDIDWSDMPAEVDEAFSASKVIVLEADMDDIDPQQIARQVMLPAGESLKDKLGEEHFETLQEHSSHPAAMLDRMRPAAVYFELGRDALGDGRAVDELIQVEARVEDKERRYLESIEEQLALFNEAVTAEIIREMLDDLDGQKAQLDKLTAAYKKGDADALAEAAFAQEHIEEFPEFYEAFFPRRNRNWIGPLEEFIERGEVFVAVGAAHLVGDDSLVEMLRQAGHEVQRVEP